MHLCLPRCSTATFMGLISRFFKQYCLFLNLLAIFHALVLFMTDYVVFNRLLIEHLHLLQCITRFTPTVIREWMRRDYLHRSRLPTIQISTRDLPVLVQAVRCSVVAPSQEYLAWVHHQQSVLYFLQGNITLIR